MAIAYENIDSEVSGNGDACGGEHLPWSFAELGEEVRFFAASLHELLEDRKRRFESTLAPSADGTVQVREEDGRHLLGHRVQVPEGWADVDVEKDAEIEETGPVHRQRQFQIPGCVDPVPREGVVRGVAKLLLDLLGMLPMVA